MKPRWDIDERGEGVADGAWLAAGADELVAALRRPNWVAEDADAHLLPHLQRACGHHDLELEDSGTGDDGSFDVVLAWKGRPNDFRALRSAVFALVGEIAESATYVRQRQDGEVVFEVGTGMLEDDSPFAPHGHTLRLRVRGDFR